MNDLNNDIFLLGAIVFVPLAFLRRWQRKSVYGHPGVLWLQLLPAVFFLCVWLAIKAGFLDMKQAEVCWQAAADMGEKISCFFKSPRQS